MKKDFELLNDILNEFVSQKSIQNRLNIIDECEITGWEIWFQIEFATFLNTHAGISEWYREESYSLDKRKSKNKHKMKVDFLIRQKNTKKDKYIAIELKQHSNPFRCIDNMLKDIVKISTARESYTDFRSYWCIGIHPREDKKMLKAKILQTSEKKDICLYNYMEIKYIPNTNFAYTIF
jgi:hypothetical protein